LPITASDGRGLQSRSPAVVAAHHVFSCSAVPTRGPTLHPGMAAVGRTHQLSFTVPIERIHDGSSVATGLGDVAVTIAIKLVGTERLSSRHAFTVPSDRSCKVGLGRGASGSRRTCPPASLSQIRWHALEAGRDGHTLGQERRRDEATTVAYNLGAAWCGWRGPPSISWSRSCGRGKGR